MVRGCYAYSVRCSGSRNETTLGPCSINDPAHSRVEGRPGLFSPVTPIGGYGGSRPQWRQGQNPTVGQAPVQPQGLVIWRGTRESQPVYFQCCPLCTHFGSQIRAGEDEDTARGPAPDGRNSCKLAPSHARPRRPVRFSRRSRSVIGVVGPRPAKKQQFPQPGAPRARPYPLRRPP